MSATGQERTHAWAAPTTSTLLPMFNLEIVAFLTEFARTRTEDGYRERQEALVQDLPCSYEELVDVAYDFEEPSVRIEALELVALATKVGYKTVLSDSAKADPDRVVKSHAEALLYRAIVNENIAKHLAANRH